MPDNETDDEWRQIEMRAAALMAGFIKLEEGDEGRPRKEYLDEGEKEDIARAAMARLLRSGRPLTQDFRDQLAALFDPNDDTHHAIGFTIDIEEAKALRDIEHRLSVFLRQRYAPSENGGLLTDAENVEESELDAMFHKRAAALASPSGYGESDATKDSERLQQLNCKRLSPPSCGGGELKGADDDEEALLTARLAAYRHSPEGRDRARMLKLMFKGRRLGVDEQDELDRLKAKYPEAPKDSPLAKAIARRLAELRQATSLPP